MKIIKDYSDFSFKVVVYNGQGMPINPLDTSTLDISVYTTNIDDALTFTKNDIDPYTLTIDVNGIDASVLQNGVLYYQYHVTKIDPDYEDGTFDATRKVQTDLYIMNLEERHKPTCATAISELVNDIGYVTRPIAEAIIDGKIDDAIEPLIRNEYSAISKVEPYLYEIEYDKLDYDYAKMHFDLTDVGACSAIRSGNLVGRNYDWRNDYSASFIIRTPKAQGHHAVIGVGGSVDGLTDEFVDSREYSDKYKLLPFFLQDGVNDAGLFAEINVVPSLHNNPTSPLVERRDSICVTMLVRYILDNFATVAEAVEYLKDYVEVYNSPKIEALGYECHFMLADGTDTRVLEIIDNQLVDIENDKSTNFHLNGVTFNADDTVYTNADVADGHLPSSQGIEEYGAGLERWNILNGASISDRTDMRALMYSVYYTNAYTLYENVWNSEFVGGDISVDTPADDASLTARIDEYREKYEQRSKDTAETWLTAHSCVYDLENKKFYITVQEREDEYGFSLVREYADVDKEYVDNEIARVEAEIPSLDGYATEGYVDGSIDAVRDEIPEVPTNVSAFTNDAGYLTEHQSLTDYATKTYVDSSIEDVKALIPSADEFVDISTFEESQEITSSAINSLIRDKADTTYVDGSIDAVRDEIPEVPTNVSAFTNDAGYLTSHQDISGKQDVLISGTNIKTINGNSILGSGNIDISSGSIDASKYLPLEIDSATRITIGTNGRLYISKKDSGKAKLYFGINGTSAIGEESVGELVCGGNLDTTFNSNYRDVYIKAGHDSYPSYIGKALYSKWNGTEYVSNEIATIEDVSTRQEQLVSGTNIKTVNGNSILGAGNIEIQCDKIDVSIGSTMAKARDDAPVFNRFTYDASIGSRIAPIVGGKTNNGSWVMSTYPTGRLNREDLLFSYSTDEQYEAGTGSIQVKLNPVEGTIALVNDISTALVNYVDASRFDESQEITSSAINSLIRTKADISTLNGYIDVSTFEDNNEAISASINQLIRTKADASVLDDYQPKLTAGTGISIDSNNVISATASSTIPSIFFKDIVGTTYTESEQGSIYQFDASTFNDVYDAVDNERPFVICLSTPAGTSEEVAFGCWNTINARSLKVGGLKCLYVIVQAVSMEIPCTTSV